MRTKSYNELYYQINVAEN